MKYAVIDLGTNTFHLLVAEVYDHQPFTKIYEEKQPARIGQGGISLGEITPEAFERGVEIVKHFHTKINALGIAEKHIFAIATSAIRNARNGHDFVSTIFNQTQITVKIISGEQEAELIYHGVRKAMQLGTGTLLIMDIGGGSVEFVVCNGEKIFWKQSFEIGGQRLLDKFMPTDPIPPANVRKLYDYLEEQLLPLTNALHQYAPTVLVGSAGVFDTLTEIYYKMENPAFEPEGQTEFELPVSGFYMIFQSLMAMNREERLQVPGMIALRADMIVVACCLLNFVLNKYDITRLKTSAYALKEGVLSSMSN